MVGLVVALAEPCGVPVVEGAAEFLPQGRYECEPQRGSCLELYASQGLEAFLGKE